MNKSEIIASVCDEFDLTARQADKLVNLVFEKITEGLVNGDKVVISGFGTFEVRTRVAREGRNPRTGETIKIEEQKTPGFKPGKVLKDAVNK